jgi:cobalt/nickel transport system permease protein
VTSPSLPEWYLTDPIAPDGAGRPRPPGRTVRRALARLAEALALELTAPAANGSWLTRLDARAQIIASVVLIVGATLLQRLPPLAALFALALGLVLAGRLSGRRLMHVLAPAGLFSLAIILPAILNIVTPGPAALVLFPLPAGAHLGAWHFPDALAITRPGLLVAARFMLRTSACVTLSYLLIAGTGSAALLNGLRRLGLPRVFGMVLTMAERYLVVLLRAAEEIHLAKLSRTIEPGPLRREQKWVAAGIGILFRRTYLLAGEVQDAMIARGYDGQLRAGDAGRPRAADYAWSAAAVVLAAGLILIDRAR